MLTQTRSVLLVVVLLASLALAACQADTGQTEPMLLDASSDAALPPPVVNVVEVPAAAPRQITQAAGAGPNNLTTAGNGPNDLNHLPLAGSAAELSQAEIDALMFMREEEKLARDVYQYLYELWGQPVFQNIAASEQAHMNSVLGLINAYGLTDPAMIEAGQYTNPELQVLYDELVEKGSLSPADALSVGALIEEVDILDLEQRLADTTNAQIVQVFDNLLRGSQNHLRAFVNNLEQLSGETYAPQMMSPEAYEAVMSSSLQPGGYGSGAGASGGTGNGAGGRGNRGGNGGGLGQAAS